ncbi:hypothetical protein ACX1JO_003809 [Cronobacter dublinensis]
MSTISNELVKDLRMAFSVWQQDYDPVEDKAQYEMFGLGVVAMDELLALRKERESAVPVAWTDVEELNDAKTCGWGYLFTVDPVSPNADPRRVIKLYAEGPAKPIDDDSLPFDPQIAEYEQMMEAEQSEAATDNTSQQFESLAGKAVVPEGWKLVPVEPSPKMLVALWEHRDSMRGVSENKIASVGYKAMLAVAPEPCK